MSPAELLFDFMGRITDDPTMGPSHLGVYVAILQTYEMQDRRNPVLIQSAGLKRLAKISAAATYYKCMRDLREGGYIRYVPSYDPLVGSLVYLVEGERFSQ